MDAIQFSSRWRLLQRAELNNILSISTCMNFAFSRVSGLAAILWHILCKWMQPPSTFFYFLDCECAFPFLVPRVWAHIEKFASSQQTRFSITWSHQIASNMPNATHIYISNQQFATTRSLFASVYFEFSVAFNYWLHPHAHKEHHHTWLLRGEGETSRTRFLFSSAACVRGAPATYANSRLARRLVPETAKKGGALVPAWWGLESCTTLFQTLVKQKLLWLLRW